MIMGMKIKLFGIFQLQSMAWNTITRTIKKFVDKHGQFGPSEWSYGQFVDNGENLPVTGISWFEARAYAS